MEDSIWIEYQPHRNREKMLYDIRLRDGVELERCYPNGNSWNAQMFGNNQKKYYRINDYRVTHIKLSKLQIGDDL